MARGTVPLLVSNRAWNPFFETETPEMEARSRRSGSSAGEPSFPPPFEASAFNENENLAAAVVVDDNLVTNDDRVHPLFFVQPWTITNKQHNARKKDADRIIILKFVIL
mmetsp:Transcript_74246/g.111857  ORF Transcript_74246/g.111857 Transcript_74246/m.111857 type:complete len:109 (-) Transcript_74246:75-401(-)